MRVTHKKLVQIIKEEVSRVLEGDLVDLFTSDEKKEQAKMRIAMALKHRAEEMLDIDDNSPNYVEFKVDEKLFLSPYQDVDGHGGVVKSMADHIYNHTQHEDVVDTSEDPLEYILGRIEADTYDEDIVYVLKALGDDRFDMPHTYYQDGDHQPDEQMMTSPVSGDSDEDWIYDVEGEMEAKMQGIESGEVVELDPDDYDDLNEATMVSLQPITQAPSAFTTQEDMWMRIAGIQVEKSEKDENENNT